jgi:DNA-binding transcriptional regulator YiaG
MTHLLHRSIRVQSMPIAAPGQPGATGRPTHPVTLLGHPVKMGAGGAMMKPIQSWNGDAFRTLREKSGTTAAELAVRLGVTEERIARWERGDEVPSGHARELLDAWLAENPPSGS